MSDESIDEAETRAVAAWLKGQSLSLLAKAEQEFGAGDMNGWTFAGFGLRDDGAGIVIISAEERTFGIALNRGGLKDRRSLLYDLAHELVHVVYAIGLGIDDMPQLMRSLLYDLAHELVHVVYAKPDGTASMLEEGCCVWFSLYGPEYPNSEDVEQLRAVTLRMPGGQNYVLALLSVEDLLALDPEAVRKLRAREPNWDLITPELILDVIPNCPFGLACLLCETRDMHDVQALETAWPD